MNIGALARTGGFVLPSNPVSAPNIPQTGNPVAAHFAMGCMAQGGRNCSGRINGMGAFEVFGFSVPGDSWMWLLGVGLAAGAYLMSRGKGR